jgi:DNA-binding XRE family transcriptional regulator
VPRPLVAALLMCGFYAHGQDCCRHNTGILAYFLHMRHDADMSFGAAQSRGARGLLGMTQAELAAKSGVSLRTIAHFEAGERQPIPANLTAIQRALETAGAVFIAENGGGPGVRLKRKPKR